MIMLIHVVYHFFYVVKGGLRIRIGNVSYMLFSLYIELCVFCNSYEIFCFLQVSPLFKDLNLKSNDSSFILSLIHPVSCK